MTWVAGLGIHKVGTPAVLVAWYRDEFFAVALPSDVVAPFFVEATVQGPRRASVIRELHHP